jgi:hypothetical protein
MKTNQEEKKVVQALPDGVTQEMIENWKNLYGKVKLKTVYPEDREPFMTVTKVPDRKVISEYFKLMDKDFERANNVLIRNCVLHFKEEILKDDELFFMISRAITDDLPIGRTVTKNL